MFHERERDRESISGSFLREPTHDVNTRKRASVNLCHSVLERMGSCLCGLLPVTPTLPPTANELENIG